MNLADETELEVMMVMQSTKTLLQNIRANPSRYAEHYWLLDEIEDITKKYTKLTLIAEIKQQGVAHD